METQKELMKQMKAAPRNSKRYEKASGVGGKGQRATSSKSVFAKKKGQKKRETKLKDATELREAGFTVEVILKLHENGVNAKTLKDAGLTVKELKEGGYNAAELREAGFTVEEMKNGGFVSKELKDAGFTVKELNLH